MKFTKSLLLFSCIGIAGAAFILNNRFGSIADPGEPDPKKEAALVRAVLDGLTRMHFSPRAIDDQFSADVYRIFLEDIDNGKRFFTQQDVNLFANYKDKIDDEAQAGTYEFFNLVSGRLDQSLIKTKIWYQEILAKPMSFSANETVTLDGKQLKWCEDDTALRKRWEQSLKYDVLSRAVEEDDKQNKPDFKGEKKTFEQLEADARKKVLDNYDKFFKRMEKMDRMRRIEIYLNSMTSVFDPHSGYYSPKEKEDFDIQMSGKLEGIGARLQSDGDKTTVVEVIPGGPAWKDGEIQNKDVVVKVAQGDDGEYIDIMGWDISDVVSKIRGPKGTKVRLTIQKPDGSTKEVTLIRDVVIMEEGFAKSLILNDESQTDKIGYIFLPKFYADFTPQGLTSCAADVEKEINKLKAENVSGIILDLRGNGGGSLRDVVQMSGLFVEKGPMVQVKSRTRRPEVNEDLNSSVQWSGPLVVMVNDYSASASEILAAAMQDYGRAVIVGSSGTYGKGTVQRFLDLDNLSNDDSVKPLGEMKLTVQKFYRVSGKTTQLDGVKPDIVLPDFSNYLENGEAENDFPLESNTIDNVPYGQNVYQIGHLDELRASSKERVAQSPTFKKVEENAVRIRKMKDQDTYFLNLDKYRQWKKRQDEEADKYEDIFSPIDRFVVRNLSVDLPVIQADTAKASRNETWLKDRKKDVQLYETLQIMYDMIRLGGVTAIKPE